MYTQCPECATVYNADAATIARGHGMVRCSHCDALFDALLTLADQLPPEPFDRLAAHAPDPDPPRLGVPVYRPNAQPATFTFDPDERPRARESRRPSTPAFARHAQRGRGRRWPWVVGTLLLSLSLAGQLAYAERDQLLDSDFARPWLDRGCNLLSCVLPLRHASQQLELLSRDIRPHPSVAGALIVSATVRNAATFAQAYPVVEITLSDLDENRVAMRRFQPRDYLGDTRAIERGLAAGASTALVFEVRDPGKNAVAFEFKFL
ncbi:MAG: hypothetical protein BGP24_18495 [Lysobacterales bacterium 69-70]|nr:zinc-ribbon and DUF3426 domain-containing protein [Xanthomonadaceae bacterium]ODU32786.1 MAG: hypothetical protein ABS97_14805 [Xanthomonadaceae bacterium SCN 69-320]ODV15948.1 MAG: hypothetical protein ABT27_21420 [Xanthomonadaceae bacterium SCN 69-25]OJY99916.1 MAG: hypothetical protein BGP24_18495 [Xanthomonadales bacterium 69-70]